MTAGDGKTRRRPMRANAASGSRAVPRTAATITSMNMSELDPALLLALPALLAALAALAALIHLRRGLGRARADSLAMRRELDLVRQSISGLTAGAVGVDRRIQRLEANGKALAERQETFEIQQADDQPYGHAIRLVQQGAGVARLVDELELSENEAELIVRLHGRRDSA